MGKGLIFKCSDRSEEECLDRMLFASDAIAKDQVLSIEPGDSLFLLNLDTDILKGVFKAASPGGHNIIPGAWKGRYPYQVKAVLEGDVRTVCNAKNVLNELKLDAHQILEDFELDALVSMNRPRFDGDFVYWVPAATGLSVPRLLASYSAGGM